MITLRRSQERGHAEHSWLNSYHSFSFADYFDPKHMSFKSLRVINEDFIQGGAGFPMHGHQHMEIITYVIQGALEHKDSLDTHSIIKPGEVQRMSAGYGIRHSEFNHFKDVTTHLYQIWITPNKQVNPSYQQKNFEKSYLNQTLTLVASNDGRNDSLTIQQDAFVYVGHLKKNQQLPYKISHGRSVWIQIIQGQLKLSKYSLSQGDAVAIEDLSDINLEAEEQTEFLLFDLI